MATYRQRRYFESLLRDLGRYVSQQELQEFSRLSVSEASAKLTELEKRRFDQRAKAEASESEEPE